ncbi:MAG TPA: tRNA 2-thiouridine(34) synthase MnmA [Dehalococcoidia bacterium]
MAGKGRVVVGMSGGVDSSTAAALLHAQGYEVIGVTMRLWTVPDETAPVHHRHCCSIEDTDDARAAAQVIGIPHYVLNFEEEFRRSVVEYFVAEYRRGRTPNPCLACNEHVKFRAFLDRARALGADYVATGHYARVARDGETYRLLRAADPEKDQSYVLYTLGQEELRSILFPLGTYTKDRVRALAAELGLPVADKPDSADICFVPGGDYRAFLAQYVPTRPGPVVDTAGNVVGQHEGVSGFTVGQRRGLGAFGARRYVVELRPEANTVVVGGAEELLSDVCWAEQLRFVNGPPAGALEVEAKIRYRTAAAPALLRVQGDRAEVRFREPQRAVTPGQAVVFYVGDEVIGGGIIEGRGRRAAPS